MNRNLLQVFIGFRGGDGGDPVQVFFGDGSAGEIVAEPEKQMPAGPAPPADPLAEALQACRDAERIIVVPGYGMAFAQAQFDVVKFATLLEESGKDVRFAIHPVAGRMPGHMDVLLAEADLSFDRRVDIDDVNPEFENTDLVIVAGACDVVNPAALTMKNTPISGMPILMVHLARRILICNLDEQPGYSGIDNPLYRNEKSIMLPGDAGETFRKLIEGYSQRAKITPGAE
jgi:NAD(P) transhydrogenase subunit beta